MLPVARTLEHHNALITKAISNNTLLSTVYMVGMPLLRSDLTIRGNWIFFFFFFSGSAPCAKMAYLTRTKLSLHFRKSPHFRPSPRRALSIGSTEATVFHSATSSLCLQGANHQIAEKAAGERQRLVPCPRWQICYCLKISGRYSTIHRTGGTPTKGTYMKLLQSDIGDIQSPGEKYL